MYVISNYQPLSHHPPPPSPLSLTLVCYYSRARDAIFSCLLPVLYITGERIVLQPLMASHIHQTLLNVGHTMMDTEQNGSSVVTRRDHNIDYSTLFVQLSGTFPTLYRCVSCHKTVSNRWHHANIHRPQSHECPVCGQKFTRRDNMKAHCKIKHADIKDRYFNHFVHMWPMNILLKYRKMRAAQLRRQNNFK